MKVMKLITKEEMNTLFEKGILRNTKKGIVDRRESNVGFYRTRNKRYIEDKYVAIARKLG